MAGGGGRLSLEEHHRFFLYEGKMLIYGGGGGASGVYNVYAVCVCFRSLFSCFTGENERYIADKM